MCIAKRKSHIDCRIVIHTLKELRSRIDGQSHVGRPRVAIGVQFESLSGILRGRERAAEDQQCSQQCEKQAGKAQGARMHIESSETYTAHYDSEAHTVPCLL